MLSAKSQSPRLLIVVPIAEDETMPSKVLRSIGEVLTVYPGSTYELVRGGPGGNHLEATAANRNAGMRDYAAYEYILSQDSDVVIEPQHIERLLRWATDNPGAVVSAAYLHRGLVNRYSASEGTSRDFVSTARTGVIPVKTVGAGALLIPRDVLTRMGSDWFDTPTIHGKQVAEDIGFSINAEKHGVPLYLNCDCVVEHLTGRDERASEHEKEMAQLLAKVKEQGSKISTLEITAMCNEAQEALVKVGAILTVLRKASDGGRHGVR